MAVGWWLRTFISSRLEERAGRRHRVVASASAGPKYIPPLMYKYLAVAVGRGTGTTDRRCIPVTLPSEHRSRRTDLNNCSPLAYREKVPPRRSLLRVSLLWDTGPGRRQLRGYLRLNRKIPMLQDLSTLFVHSIKKIRQHAIRYFVLKERRRYKVKFGKFVKDFLVELVNFCVTQFRK